MSTKPVPQDQPALDALRTAAATARAGWLPEASWHKVAGPGPDTMKLVPAFFLQDIPVASFEGLTLEPGHELVLATDLHVPQSLAGVVLLGDSLELGITSVYPMRVSLDGVQLFRDDTPPVAAGPALVQAVRSIGPGCSGRLEVTIVAPGTQLADNAWVHLHFTTPALRERYDRLDLLAAQLELAAALATEEDELKAVAAFAALVPEDPLGMSPPALTGLVEQVQQLLEPLATKMSAVDIHLVGHSHIDLAWLWTWEDTVEVIKRDVRSVLDMMDDYPEMTFTHSQPPSYQVLQEQAPDLFERVLDHISTGRWEPATMQWVESDTNLPSGESTVRQLVEGVRFTEEQLGVTPTVLLAPDTFGHAGNLPQLAASAGATVYYHHRANPGQTRREGLWPAYWWEGQDGTRLLAVSTPSYVGELSASSIVRALLDGPMAAGHSTALHFYGIGDHGGGPTRQSLDRRRWLSDLRAFPTLTCSTVAAYATALVGSGAVLPTHRGESSTLFEGCYTTHADTKRLNREAENLLTSAESLAAVAGLGRREELSEAWRAVLLHQFHDILDGSAIRDAYVKNAQDCEASSQVARGVIDSALDVLEAMVGEGSIAVTNPLGWARTDFVVVPGLVGSGPITLVAADGTRTPGQHTEAGLCFVATVPPFGTVPYRLEQTQEQWDGPTVGRPDGWAADPSKYVSVSTRSFDAVVRRDCGIITSLIDRRVDRQLVAFGMRRKADYLDTARADLGLNVLTVIDERPHDMAAWHYDEVAVETHLLSGATTTVVEHGPVRVVLEVERSFRHSWLRQRLVFYRDLPRIDVETEVDWQEIGSPDTGIPGLKAAFTARLPEVAAWFETPYAAVQRHSDGQEVPALRWASVGGPTYGLSILNTSKHGYDALGGRLRLSLLRNAYDPDAQSDTGRHQLSYAIYPHPGDWREARVVEQAAGLNQPLLARVHQPTETAADGPVFRPEVSIGSVGIGVVSVGHRGGRVIRLHETQGSSSVIRLSGLDAAKAARETTVTERPLRPLDVVDGVVELSFGPWQVRTVVVDL